MKYLLWYRSRKVGSRWHIVPGEEFDSYVNAFCRLDAYHNHTDPRARALNRKLIFAVRSHEQHPIDAT